ncbi:MAG: Lipid A export ATP-binding/permease protein MsbA [Alphaproteobacteria bacterium MarineAlpha5_Bin12]|nr:MAG: Lipid A export ATP-binding/permease protein MsbA [Alphaproteobacteria bacterium MarineAlpha5_Bin12]|tara:strand:+ start:4017 stop:5765 length:1749 start_codon:yes stop_codon:yes gene_type:complete
MIVIKKLWNILEDSDKKKCLYLFFLTIISMFLEILGIGLVIPAITILITDDITSQYPQVIPILNYFDNPTHFQIVIFGMSTLLCVYLIKNVFIAYFYWYQSKYTYGIQVSVSQRLYQDYIRQPYLFHLRRNSAQLIRNIQEEVSQLQGAIQFILTLVIEFLIFGGIVVLLIYVEPVGAIIAGITIGLVIWAFNIRTKKYFKIWGKEIQYHSGQAKQHLMQGLAGVKELKLSGKEKNFFSLYFENQSITANKQILFNVSNSLPRLLFEFLALVGLTIIVIIMFSLNSELDVIISTLALFGMAAFRLMPSTNRIVSSFQALWYTTASIEKISQELSLLKKNLDDLENNKIENTIKFKKESVLKVNKVDFSYPLTSKQTLSKISFIINQGETIGFVGQSGSGKTTLIDLILGLLEPDSGSISVNNVNINDFKRNWQSQIGYVPQTIYLTDDTLKNNIAFGIKNKEINDNNLENSIYLSELTEMIKNLPDGLNTEVGERGVRLSGGQRQRIGIARALYHNPEILVLDEATSSLDTDTESSIVDSLKEIKGKKTILIIAHRQSTVKYCDRLIRIKDGKIQGEEIIKI